jgi:hypothetical protein
VIFSSNINKTSQSSRDGAYKKENEKKAPRVSLNKRGSQYFERRKHFNFKNSF